MRSAQVTMEVHPHHSASSTVVRRGRRLNPIYKAAQTCVTTLNHCSTRARDRHPPRPQVARALGIRLLYHNKEQTVNVPSVRGVTHSAHPGLALKQTAPGGVRAEPSPIFTGLQEDLPASWSWLGQPRAALQSCPSLSHPHYCSGSCPSLAYGLTLT